MAFDSRKYHREYMRKYRKSGPENKKVARTPEEQKEYEMGAQDRYRKKNPLKYIYSLAKRRSKSRGIEFNIELSDLTVPDYCPLLEVKIDNFNPDNGYHASIDRINPTKGYIKGNVMVVSFRANRLKNNSSSSELLLLANNLYKYEVVS